MKRLLSTSLLMFALSLPVFAGHTLQGDWCGCGAPACICDPGEPLGSMRGEPKKPNHGKPAELGAETLLVLAALLLVLRYKA
jgi:hypothetical protein